MLAFTALLQQHLHLTGSFDLCRPSLAATLSDCACAADTCVLWICKRADLTVLVCTLLCMQTVSGLPQVGFAFNRIESAFSYLVNNMGKFSGLAAQTERLDALFAGMHPAQAHVDHTYCCSCSNLDELGSVIGCPP